MKKFLSLFLSLIFLFVFSSCSVPIREKKFTKTFLDLFDTVSSVTAYDNSEKEFEAHYQLFYDELESYAQLYDIYKDYSGVVNLKYVNENAFKAPVQVDKKIMDLLLFGKEAYEISGGKVNICMGAVLSLWHGECENAKENPQEAKLPDKGLLQQAALHTDINNLVLDEENSTVYFKDSEMKIDAGAIAKGFAADRIAEYICENNFWKSAILSLGGNIKTIGLKEGGSPFVIGIEKPDNTSEYAAQVFVKNGESVVTSGDYQRFYSVNGKKYCHIIDPETWMPAEFVSSVSVITDNSAYADMLSTALFNMSIEEGTVLVNHMENTEAIWIDKSGNPFYSSDFNRYTVQKQ